MKTFLWRKAPRFFYALIFLCLAAQCSLKVTAREHIKWDYGPDPTTHPREIPSSRCIATTCAYVFIPSNAWKDGYGNCAPDVHFVSNCVPVIAFSQCTPAGSLTIGNIVVSEDDNQIAQYRAICVDGVVEMELLDEL